MKQLDILPATPTALLPPSTFFRVLPPAAPTTRAPTPPTSAALPRPFIVAAFRTLSRQTVATFPALAFLCAGLARKRLSRWVFRR